MWKFRSSPPPEVWLQTTCRYRKLRPATRTPFRPDELLVDVQLRLVRVVVVCVFHVRACPLEPRRVTRAEAAPVHELEAEPSCCWLDVPAEDVVVAHRLASTNALEDEIIRSVLFDELVRSYWFRLGSHHIRAQVRFLGRYLNRGSFGLYHGTRKRAILLGHNAHSIVGIMRGTPLPEDWEKAAQGTLGFTHTQNQQIRMWIYQRSSR